VRQIIVRPVIVAALFLTLASLALASDYTGKAVFSAGDLVFARKAGYDVITMKDADPVALPGRPMLPAVEIDVALPRGAVVSGVRLVDARFVDLEGRFDVMPCPRPRRISNPPLGNPFIKDAATYARDAFFPERAVELAGTWELAGQEFVTIRLFPVAYNPASGKVRLAESLSWEVTFDIDPGRPARTYNFSPRVRALYRDMLRKRAVNPGAVSIPAGKGGGSRSLPAGDYEYVVITPRSFEHAFDLLVKFYTAIGIPATVVTTQWIGTNYAGSSTEEQIRAFIADANSTWGTIYVLLGGDTRQVAYKPLSPDGDDMPNDTYYADYDGDWKIEVYVGRAPVDDTAEIDTFISKTLAYMTTPPAGFGDEVFMMGFDLDSYTPSEELMKYIHYNYMPSWLDYDSEYDSESGAHLDDCRNYINAGASVINHSDHSGTDCVGIGYTNHGNLFFNGDAASFTNGERTGIFYTLGCWPGNYEAQDCFGEELVKNPGGGAVAFVGNSRYGWYVVGSNNYYSSKYDKKFFKALWVGNHYRAGETLGESKNDAFPGDSLERYVFTELNLQGDPAMPVWTLEPGSYNCTCDQTIGTGPQNFTVNVKYGLWNAGGALVCLYKGDFVYREVYERGTTDSSGNVVFAINPKTPGTMRVTVTGQNMKLFPGSCTVTGPPPDLDITLALNKEDYGRGEKIHYTIGLTNNTGSSLATMVWTNVSLPMGGVYPQSGFLDGPWPVSLNPQQTKTAVPSLKLPLSAPLGNFVFNAYTGPNPGVEDEEHVPFHIIW
jgi:hypothetical protein